MWRRRAAFSIARSPPIPTMSRCPSDRRAANVSEGLFSYVPDPMAAFEAAEAKLTKALSSVPDHALGHLILGYVEIFTKRAAEGIAECEHALTLDQNLAYAMPLSGLARFALVAPKKQRLT